ncbi:MAG: hypothetical protein C0454_02375 [Parvibaculum sp.]|jgi:uncharacterized protein (TIGR02117 family)|nr:hypothetical protein [Parvibaculum sp.]
MKGIGLALILLAALFPAASRVSAMTGAHTVYVSSNDWHTGIVVAVEDIPADRIPESADFPDAVFLEFGWGDADFYPEPDAGVLAAIGAAFPGPAVVHVAALTARPSEYFSDVEEIELQFAPESFAVLIDYLHESFAREGARAEVSAKGLYDFSAFYPATGRFSLANTCNTWSARGLEAAGLPVQSRGVQRAEDLMRQLRPLANSADVF